MILPLYILQFLVHLHTYKYSNFNSTSVQFQFNLSQPTVYSISYLTHSVINPDWRNQLGNKIPLANRSTENCHVITFMCPPANIEPVTRLVWHGIGIAQPTNYTEFSPVCLPSYIPSVLILLPIRYRKISSTSSSLSSSS